MRRRSRVTVALGIEENLKGEMRRPGLMVKTGGPYGEIGRDGTQSLGGEGWYWRMRRLRGDAMGHA